MDGGGVGCVHNSNTEENDDDEAALSVCLQDPNEKNRQRGDHQIAEDVGNANADLDRILVAAGGAAIPGPQCPAWGAALEGDGEEAGDAPEDGVAEHGLGEVAAQFPHRLPADDLDEEEDHGGFGACEGEDEVEVSGVVLLGCLVSVCKRGWMRLCVPG